MSSRDRSRENAVAIDSGLGQEGLKYRAAEAVLAQACVWAQLSNNAPAFRLASARIRTCIGLSSRRCPILKSTDNSQALAAFIARKPEIDSILGRLTTLSGDRFNAEPDAVTWGDVGTLGSYLGHLCAISDAAFQEGERAG